MRIIVLVDAPTGGAGNIAQLLAGELAAENNEVTLLFTSQRTISKRYSMPNVACGVVDLNVSGFGRFRRTKIQVDKLRESLQEYQPDLVICFLGQLVAFAGIASIGKPWRLIACERNDPKCEPLHLSTNVMRFIGYCRADSVSVQFNHYKEIYGSLFKKKCYVTPNYINVPTRTKSYGAKESSRKIRFISLGRIVPQKNFELMVNLFQRVHSLRPETELHIYGNGSLGGSTKQELVDLIKKNALDGAVILHDPTETPYDVLADSDIYLMTSKYEGFPNALCEAMAVGLPCVAFECHKGLHEIIDNWGNGFLINPNDQEAFINCCLELIDDATLRKTIGERAKNLLNRFSRSVVTQSWKDCINHAMGH